MSTEYIKRQLKHLGLSGKEAEIYVACLRFSPINPTQLARITNTKRSTLYLYVEKLKGLGLLSSRILGKKHLIVSTPVTTFQNLVEDKKSQVKQQAKILKEVLPYLEKLAKDKVPLGSIEILEGETGAAVLLEKVIKSNEDIYWIGSIDTLLSAIPDEKFFKLLTWRRMDQHTTAYAITDQTILKKEKYSNNQGKFRQMKILPEDIKIPVVLAVFNKQVALISVKNSKAHIVLISDEIMSEMVLFVFKQLWKRL